MNQKTINRNKALITAAKAEISGMKRPLLAAASKSDLAEFTEDRKHLFLADCEQVDEIYFMFACFILLHFGEEF